MPLPWAPKSLLSDTEDWSFANGANRAMTDLATMGERLMQPVGQQVRSVVEQAMPAPATMPQPAPVTPSVPRFSLGRVEDWLTPAGQAQPAPQLEQPATPTLPAAPAPTAAPATSGMFSLPSLESFLGRPSSAAAPGPAAAPSTQGPAGPPPAFGPIVGGNKADFLRTAGPIAARVEQETGIPARLSLAISANETGWGNPKYTPGGAYHGIQARRGEAGTGYTDVTATGQPYRASLRSFASPYEAFRGFADFLRQNPRYAPALAAYKQTGDANRLAADIKAAGYAEDPAYASKIQGIMAGIPDIRGPRRAPAPDANPRQPASPYATPPKPTPGPETGSPATLDVGGITAAYKGVPYTFGGPGGRGQGVGATTDCSGFVAAVWKNQYGLDLPAHTDTSYNALRKLGAPEVSAADARPGDVVYYMGAGTGGAITHHMGIFAGPGKVLDMSTSGTSGAAVRDLGHAGRHVILRDPRVNPQAPERSQAPPPIVPTGIAERTGGEAMRTVQARTPAAAAQPAPPEAPPAPAAHAPPEPMYDPREADEGPHEGANGAVAQAFRHVNGFLPSAEQLSALVSRVYGG